MLIVGTLFHIFAMSAIKWQISFVDCSLIHAHFQRLFIFKTFEFGINFGPSWFSLGFEFETIYGKNCKKMNNPTKNQLSYSGWVGKKMSWSENYQPVQHAPSGLSGLPTALFRVWREVARGGVWGPTKNDINI